MLHAVAFECISFSFALLICTKMSLSTHPLLSLLDEHATGLKSLLTHYIDATVDSQFASLRNSIETMIQSGVIGPNCDGTHFGMTLPPQTHTNTHQSSDECSHEYSNDQLTRTQEGQNNQQNEVSLSNTINTESVIKQEFYEDDEDGEEIYGENVAKCENCEKGICTSVDAEEIGENGDESSGIIHHNFYALENNQITKLIISNDISPSPSPTNPTNTEPLIKQEYPQDEQTERQNTQIPHHFEFDENEYFHNSNCENCANGDCDLDHENNNNQLNNQVAAGDGDGVDNGYENEHSNLQSISSSTANQMTNIETDQIARAVIIEPNNQQSTQSTSGVRFSTRKRISKKIFGDDQSNDDAKRHKSAKGKKVQSNKSVKKAKHTIDTRATPEHYEHSQSNSDEAMVIQQEQMVTTNAIGEEIETNTQDNRS